jgi:hypothetical protein
MKMYDPDSGKTVTREMGAGKAITFEHGQTITHNMDRPTKKLEITRAGVVHDLYGLQINNKPAHELTVYELYRQMRRIGMDDIDIRMGPQSLLLRLSEHYLAEQKRGTHA